VAVGGDVLGGGAVFGAAVGFMVEVHEHLGAGRLDAFGSRIDHLVLGKDTSISGVRFHQAPGNR
jgi:hypothetical protein